MEQAVILYQLDLLIRLIDTTSGMQITERKITLYNNGNQVDFLYKGEGLCALINIGRKPFALKAQVNGFEDRTVWVDYQTLDMRLPVLEIPMIPRNSRPESGRLYTVKGCLKGITALEGISCNHCFFRINHIDEDNQMTIFNPHNKRMNLSHYGLFHQRQGTFEPFTVISQISPDTVKIKHPIKGSFEINEPIMPLIFGMVKDDGSYIFRARTEAESQSFILRYVTEEKERFCRLDFKCQGKSEWIGLLEGGK